MIIYNAITIACLALMIAGLITVAVNLIMKNRSGRITYIRSFKKGKGALIYVFAIPLYWIGHVYAGQSVIDGFFGAVRRIIELVVLKYDTSSIQALFLDNSLYQFAIYFSFVLVGLNAILFALSLANQYLWNYFTKLCFKFSRKEKLVIFGNNEQNYCIYNSEKNRAKILIDKIVDKSALDLYMKGVYFNCVTSYTKYIKQIIKFSLAKSRKTIVIINSGDDERNIELSRIFIERITALDEQNRQACFNLLKLFVFGDPRYEAIYEDICEDGLGCISYVNKYKRIAMDFIDKYPFASFMDQRHIDYETSLVKKGVDINTFFIGFGKTNQHIFLTSVANNQFIEKADNGIGLKKVNYYIFDKNPAENNKNLNHNYNRFKNECAKVDKDDYLDLPDYPAKEHFLHLDVNDVNFYNEIRSVATRAKKGLNFIVIAFGSDLENIDMAQKLAFKCREWSLDNIVIFVKVRSEHKGQCLLEEENCYIIANEKDVVYNINNIVGDSIFKMAQMRNEVYSIEYELTKDDAGALNGQDIADIKAKAYKDWYVKKTQLERDSNLYGCLSLRSKLNLMGLDYCKKDDNDKKALTEQEYLEKYANGDMPDFARYNFTADGKPIAYYTLEFMDSRRKNLAIHEHLRWNSFMISKGMVPATKEQILKEKDSDGKFTNGKNYSVRRHGNITTFNGLVDFRQMVAKRDKKPDESLATVELRKDVIKYDYQLLDDAYWLLDNNGYKIVRR